MEIGKEVATIHVKRENPIVSYRFWTVSRGRLVSPFWMTLHGPIFWNQLMIAEKFGCDHEIAPSLTCDCGIYSFKTEKMAYDALRELYWNSYAVGAIEIWGVIIVHEHGYRSQLARPVSVRVKLHATENGDVLSALKSNYKDVEFEIV